MTNEEIDKIKNGKFDTKALETYFDKLSTSEKILVLDLLIKDPNVRKKLLEYITT